MATPEKIWKTMLFRYVPKKGQERFDPLREIGGHPLTKQQQALQRLENPAADLALSDYMRVWDDIERQQQARMGRVEELRGLSEAARNRPLNLPSEASMADIARRNPSLVRQEVEPQEFVPTQELGREEIDMGFSTGGGDRYDDRSWGQQSSDEAVERAKRFQRGAKAATDRRMGQIADQLIDIDRQLQAGNIDRETANRFRTELTKEYQQLERQRLGVKRSARDQGSMDPDDVEGGPLSEEFRPYQPGDPLPARFQDRAVLISETERELKEILAQAYLAQSRGSDEELDALRVRAELLQKQLARYQSFPMGSPPRRSGEFLEDVAQTMADPQLGRAATPDRKWAENYLRIMRFVPLEGTPRPTVEDQEIPKHIAMAMGLLDYLPSNLPSTLGGKVIERGMEARMQGYDQMDQQGALEAKRRKALAMVRELRGQRGTELGGVSFEQ